MTIDNNGEENEVVSDSVGIDPISHTDMIISDDLDSETDADREATEEAENREDSRFKEGQVLRFVRVRFPGNSRSFPFLVGKRHIEYGQKVVAMSDRGMAVGYVNSFPYDVSFNKSMLPVRSISKVAMEEDIVKDRDAYHQQKNAENICNDLIVEYQLDMHLTHVEFTSFGKKAVFYFIAPSRVDFRDLVKDLVGRLKTRIELRQISVRDRSASVGGIGPCGRELCCSSFLTKYGNVGIKMAKNQDLTLNFSKLNGVCGQLKCCLQYEDEVYREKRSKLPREGDIISTHTGEIGRVDRLHLLSEQFVMMTNKGIRKRYVVELFKDTLNKEEANFPKEFESVSDETFKVVGLDESEAKKIKVFEEETVKIHKNRSKYFADKVFESLFGEKTLDYSLPELEEPEGTFKKTVLDPEEEEELRYTPSAEDLLDDDEEEEGFTSSARDIVQHPIGGRQTGRDTHGASEAREARAPREPRDRDAGSNQGQGRNQNRGSGGGGRGQQNPNRNQNQNANPNRGSGARPARNESSRNDSSQKQQHPNPNQGTGARPKQTGPGSN